MESLTEKQQRVLQFIKGYVSLEGRTPSYREIQKKFKYKSIRAVQNYIVALREKGYLEVKNRKWHGLNLTADLESVPLLGKVAAGRPIQYLKFNEKIDVPKGMVLSKGEFFALQVLGDSMIDEGILENDYVIIKKQENAENGQIVVAMVDEEATIKTFYKKKNHVELHSANEKYAPIVIQHNQNFQIAGRFYGLIRKIWK